MYWSRNIQEAAEEAYRKKGEVGMSETQNTRQVDETGWLIEKGQLCLGSSCGKPAWVTFTDPSAVRFARKSDAENMLNSLRSMSDAGAFQNCTINDHAWIGPLAASGSTAATDAQEEELKEPINDLVQRFSTALRLKLIASEEKYGWQNGWLNDDWSDDLRRDIRKHLEKGDPRDVAAYCAFAWHHGWSLSGAAAVSPASPDYPAILERERTLVAEGVTAVKKAISEREWLTEGRGSYEWDDDRWHSEFGAAINEILVALKPLERVAADWSNCPPTWDDVQKARAELGKEQK